MRRKASDLENKIPSVELTSKSYKSEQFRIDELLDILVRICDACHDIDGRIEPWTGIRRDIEGLK